MKTKVKELYEAGYYYTEIATKLGKDPRTIKKIVINNGFKKLTTIRRSKYSLNESFFDEVGDTQLWLIGLLAADGWIRKNSIGLSQSGNHGVELINYVKNIIDYSGVIYTSTTTNELAYSISFTSNKFVKILEGYNIVNGKSLIYKLPELNTEDELRSFTRGYIDGDGSIGIYDNGKGYKSLTISFVGTKEFIDTIGDKIPIPYSNKLDKKRNNCWELRWYGKKAYDFGCWLYKNKNLFRSNKFITFAKYNKPNYIADYYDEKKEIVKKLLLGGIPVSKISEDTGIPFQTIYKWKKKF
jgi:hypothetical protein